MCLHVSCHLADLFGCLWYMVISWSGGTLDDYAAQLAAQQQHGYENNATSASVLRGERYPFNELLAATELRDGTHLPKASNWVVKCRDMIDRHYTEPTLNVNELADQLQVHRATLFRVFKQTYKMTPSQYLQNRRLHYAMELLKAGRHSIKEVAQLSGVTDQNYLTKLIRRKSGFSPRDFRASYNKGRLTLS